MINAGAIFTWRKKMINDNDNGIITALHVHKIFPRDIPLHDKNTKDMNTKEESLFS